MLGLTGQTSPSPTGLAGNNNRSGLNSQGGWDGSTAGNRGVDTGSLSYPGLPTSGNKAQTFMTTSGASTDRRFVTPLSAGPGKTYYISALLNYGAIRSHYIELQLRNYVGTTLTSSGTVKNTTGGDVSAPTLWGLFNIGGPGANYYMIGPSATTGATAIGFSPDSSYLGAAGQVPANTSVLLVAKLAYGDAITPGTFEVFANPDLTKNEVQNAGTRLQNPNLSGETSTVRYAGSWNTLTIVNGSGESDGFIDEIRVATTWDEAVGIAPVPEPGALGFLAAAGGLGGCFWLCRRRRCSRESHSSPRRRG